MAETNKTKSGTPPISSALLAPTETGTQLLRLPDSEFEARSMRTPGVTKEQAKAFQSKLWQLHVDSQRAPQQRVPAESEDLGKALGRLDIAEKPSSRETDPELSGLPFKERIRPGMVVSWTPMPDLALELPGGRNLAMVLCPAEAAGHKAKGILRGKMHSKNVDQGEGKEKGYLCAWVFPSMAGEGYEINPWEQVVVDTGAMNAEVCLQYEPATRCCYLVV